MKRILLVFSVFLQCCIIQANDGKVLLDKPAEMNLSMNGKSELRFHVMRSAEVPAKPLTAYRCSVRVKMQVSQGNIRVRVRQIDEAGKSISYFPIAILSPTLMDFQTFSNVFVTNEKTVALQVYYQLNKVEGQATFADLVLEEISQEEASRFLKEMAVPPALFSPPVYCYRDESELEWGYRISSTFLEPKDIPAEIEFSIAGTELKQKVKAVVDIHCVEKCRIDLKKGKYRIVMRSLDPSGKVLSEEESVLRVIDRPVRKEFIPVKKIFIDRNNNLLVNDIPIIPFQIYHVYSPEEMKQVRDAGFNVVQCWANTPEKLKKFMDQAAANGLMGSVNLKMANNQYLLKLKELLDGHPAYLFADIVDEPDVRDILPAKVLERSTEIRKIFPSYPRRISFSEAASPLRYRASIDIAATHIYPIPFGKKTNGSSVKEVADGVTRMVSELDGANIPVHFTLQSWINNNDPVRREQTYAETRAMTYLALIHGAKGLAWYSFVDQGSWDVRCSPRLWSTFKGLSWEVESLTPSLLLGKRISGITVSEPAVHFAAWDHQLQNILIAVNTSTEKKKVSFLFKELKFMKAEEMFGDDMILDFTGNTLSLELQPLETRIFNLTK